MTRRELFAGAGLACGFHAAGSARTGGRWMKLVKSHLGNLAKYGTDRYGPETTPMWMASLDLQSKAYPEREPMARAGRRVYRDIASPFGSSIYWDLPQIAAAYEVSRLSGEEAYRKSAESYVRSFLARGVDANGLFEWGNHRYYDAYKDKAAHFAGGPHEMRPIPPCWDVFWEIDPNATEREIRVSADRHIIDRETGEFTRHDEAKSPHAFLEAGGILAESLCWLGKRTGDKSVVDLALKVAGFSYRNRNLSTGLIENNPSVTRWDKHVSTTEVGLWAGSLLRAASYSGREEFRTMAEGGVSAYLKYGFDEKGGRYYGQLKVADGTPVLKENPVPGPEEYWPGNYADIWNANFPAHDYPMALATTCVDLYSLKRQDSYATAIRRWAGVVEAAPVPTTAKHGRGAYAELFGRAIHFQLRAADALREKKYRATAERLAANAESTLFTEGMFRGHGGEDRYDAVDGVGYLLLALIYLDTGQPPNGRGFGF